TEGGHSLGSEPAEGRRRGGSSRRWYRLLAHAFPAGLRERHGEDMAQLFSDRCREARAGVSTTRGVLRVALLWLAALRDAAVHGLLARRAPADRRRESALAALLFDLRHAVQGLLAARAFTAVALITLALGIGATTTIFTLVNAIILRPLPVVHAPERLVRISFDGIGLTTRSLTNPQWEALRDRQQSFDSMFAEATVFWEVGSGEEAERVRGAWVSGRYFTTLGLHPTAGRLFVDADDARGCAPAAALGYGFWRRRYGADPDIVGRTILLNGEAVPVVGVGPPGFGGMTLDAVTDVYVPLCAQEALRGERSILDARRTWALRVIGRRPDGVSFEELRAALAAVTPAVLADSVPLNFSAERQADYLDGTVALSAAGNGFSQVREQYAWSLLVLLAAVGVVQLTVCGNLANLFLARAAGKRWDIAMRIVVGAGRARLLAQSLAESLLLAGVGAAAGALLAYGASPALVAMITPPGETLALDLTPDARVLLFTIAVTVLTGALFGLAPAAHALRVDPQAALRGGPGGGGGAPSLLRGGALVAAQVTLSLILLTGAALLGATFWRLATLDPGFDRDHVMLVDVDLSHSGFDAEQDRQTFLDLLERLRLLPGVRAASVAEVTPVSGSWITEFVVPDGFESLLEEDAEVFVHRVGDDYFASMGASVLRGRDFTAADGPGSEPVAVISESMARLVFDDLDPVGKLFYRRLNDTEVDGPIRVIGVVADAKYRSLRDEDLPTVYFALRQQPTAWWDDFMTFQVLSEPAAPSLDAAVRAAVAGVAPGARAETSALAARLSASLARERLLAILSAFFGGLTLLLAVIGLYGVMSFHVARRFSEIGVRLALGSTGPKVFALVLRQSVRPVAIGLVLGTLGSLAVTRTVASLLYGIGPRDPRALLVSAAVLAVAALGSAALPARRAARLDPVEVLRPDA
ncbi:MAG: ADOP family duplicated permease, partial [Acidobacteriota bacterium]